MSTDPRPWRQAEGHRCDCPACAAESALVLLETGRTAMALRLLRGLPERLHAALDAAYAAGRGGRPEGRQSAATAPAPPPQGKPRPNKGATAKPDRGVVANSSASPARPGFRRVADELARHVERLGAARVAEVLAVRPVDLGPLLQGRVSVTKSALDRLRRVE